MEVKVNIRVASFPVEDYGHGYLESINDERRIEIALSNPNCNIWRSIVSFQNDLNIGLVDIKNNWIYFF